MTAAPRLQPADAERRCIDGIAAVELYGEGINVADLDPDADTIEGVILYAQLLEATMMTLYAAGGRPTDLPAIRSAARDTAGAWRKRA